MSSLPDWINPNRRLMRAPINPRDVSTIVSILPKPIDEKKHTIFPGHFKLAPGTFENPSILVVGSSCWWRDVGEDQPLLEIPVYSTQIAQSVVEDYCGGYLAANGDTAKPGLFWLPDALTVEEVKLKYKQVLVKANDAQNKWLDNLIRLADSLWVRSNNNPSAIGDDMRMAAKMRGLAEKKEWMANARAQEMDRCKSCGALVDTKYPVCGVCKAIVNEDLAKKLNIKFAS